MSVAPSFQNLEKVGSPFIENGREYIYVICKNGNKRKVRWYTEKERAKIDAKKEVTDKYHYEGGFEHFGARHAFHFDEPGFITIYKGNEDAIEEWRETLPVYSVMICGWFGYYSPSYFTEQPPEGITPIRLDWQEISRHPEDPNCKAMKDGDWVLSYVNEKIYGKSNSQYQGSPNEWLTHAVLVKKNIETETHYGETHIHILEDVEGNQYVWTTASKNLEEGRTYMLKMKVKEHKEYKGVKQTVVYYCKVLEEQ